MQGSARLVVLYGLHMAQTLWQNNTSLKVFSFSSMSANDWLSQQQPKVQF
jgi:hypothetical protein